MKGFCFDELLNVNGHSIVRLPPYMCELNSVELGWVKVKRIVTEANIMVDFSLLHLEETRTLQWR